MTHKQPTWKQLEYRNRKAEPPQIKITPETIKQWLRDEKWVHSKPT